MAKISIQELANVLVERRKLNRRDASLFVSAMFDIVQQRLETDKLVKVKGLGTFKIIDVEDRESVNVNTGERVLIEGHGKITFTPDSLLKELVNKPFAQFETVVLNDGVDFDDMDNTDSEVAEPELDSEPVVVPEPEPVVVPEPEAVVAPEPEPQIVGDEDHSSLPLVDFGGNDEPVVVSEDETVEDVDDEQEDDDILETTIIPDADSAQQVESELDIKLEPEMEDKMVSPDSKSIEEISDEDIPEWVIEPYVASPAAEAEPVQSEQQSVEPKDDEACTAETAQPNSNLQSILSSFQTIKKPEPALEPEPVQEEVPEPESMVAPEPDSMVAPEPELVPSAEPAEPVEPVEPVESLLSEDSMITEESVQDVDDQPSSNADEGMKTADEELDAAFENEEEAEEDNELYEIESPRKSSGKWLLALLACFIGLGAGYILGSYYPYTMFLETEPNETVIHVQKETVSKPNTQSVQKVVVKDNEATTAADDSQKKEKLPESKQDEVAVSKANDVSKATTDDEAKEDAALEKINTTDVRVRLGAYRIVGTDKVVKVKEGENLVKISRRYLGPDMECYVEVYNNIKAATPLKVGQEIKIPKLQIKKKKKAATAN